MKSLKASEPRTPKVSLLTQSIFPVMRYVGFYTRVAERLGVDPSHVRRVALGHRQSERVAAVIAKELAAIETNVRIPAKRKPRIKFRVRLHLSNGDVIADSITLPYICEDIVIARASGPEVSA